MASSTLLSEPYKFRTNLFTGENGLPIKFSMRPSEERSRLRPVIEHGGGILTSKSATDTIRLAEPGCRILSENCYSTRYVWESAKANQLLNMQDYRSQQHQPFEGSDISETDNRIPRIPRFSQRKIRGRKEYNLGDDQAIIDFIVETRRHAEIKGTALWKDMERKKVIQGRTWQSLKERFMKQIHPSISSYHLTDDQIRRFRAPFSNEKDRYSSEDNCSTDDEVIASSTADDRVSLDVTIRKPMKYMRKEDMAIIGYVLQDRDNLNMVSGNTLWKQMSILKITPHTWQSMKERFLKRILPNIGSYVIPHKYEKRLEKLIELYPATARSHKIVATRKETRIEDSESPSSSSCNGFPENLVNHHELLPTSPVFNKIEESGSCVVTSSSTNITRNCDIKSLQSNDKLDAAEKILSSENCTIMAPRQLETTAMDRDTVRDDQSVNTECLLSGKIGLVCEVDMECEEIVEVNGSCENTHLNILKKHCFKPEEKHGIDQFKTMSKNTMPDCDMPVLLPFASNMLVNGREVCKASNIVVSCDPTDSILDSNIDDASHAVVSGVICLKDQSSEEMEISVKCSSANKTNEPVNTSELDCILKPRLTVVNGTSSSRFNTDDANLTLNGTAVTVGKSPINGISKKLEDSEATVSLPVNGKQSLFADERFLRIVCNLAANLPEAVLEKHQSIDPADNGCVADEDSASDVSFVNRHRKIHKRTLCVLSSSTDASEAEPADGNNVSGSQLSKENAVLKRKKSKRLKMNTNVAGDVKSPTSSEGCTGENNACSSESEGYTSPVRIQDHTKMLLPQVVGIEKSAMVLASDNLLCVTSTVGTLAAVTKTTYTPRLHALARRKQNASMAYQMLCIVNDLPSDSTTLSLKDEERIMYMLQVLLGLQKSDVHELLSRNNFNYYTIFKQLFAEISEENL